MLRTKWQLSQSLFRSLLSERLVRVRCQKTNSAVVGTLQSVEREDGSGNCFNLTILTPEGNRVTVFWRSED